LTPREQLALPGAAEKVVFVSSDCRGFCKGLSRFSEKAVSQL
jgi:hypothetical protein